MVQRSEAGLQVALFALQSLRHQPGLPRAVKEMMYATRAGTLPANVPPGLVSVQTPFSLNVAAVPIQPEVNRSSWEISDDPPAFATVSWVPK